MIRCLCICLLLFGCKAQQKSGHPDDPKAVVEFEKKGCRGYCPKYTMRVLSDHTLEFVGDRNVAAQGRHIRALSEQEWLTTMAIIESAEIRDLDRIYDNGVVDVPFHHLRILRGEGYQEVSCRGDAPKPLGELEDHLEQMAQSQNWIEKANLETREIITLLSDATAVARLEERYNSIGMKLRKRISPRQLYFVFDIEAGGDPEEILAILKEDVDIKTVQWNRELNRRDR